MTVNCELLRVYFVHAELRRNSMRTADIVPEARNTTSQMYARLENVQCTHTRTNVGEPE